jgi:hypothetical protein
MHSTLTVHTADANPTGAEWTSACATQYTLPCAHVRATLSRVELRECARGFDQRSVFVCPRGSEQADEQRDSQSALEFSCGKCRLCKLCKSASRCCDERHG